MCGGLGSCLEDAEGEGVGDVEGLRDGLHLLGVVETGLAATHAGGDVGAVLTHRDVALLDQVVYVQSLLLTATGNTIHVVLLSTTGRRVTTLHYYTAHLQNQLKHMQTKPEWQQSFEKRQTPTKSVCLQKQCLFTSKSYIHDLSLIEQRHKLCRNNLT